MRTTVPGAWPAPDPSHPRETHDRPPRPRPRRARPRARGMRAREQRERAPRRTCTLGHEPHERGPRDRDELRLRGHGPLATRADRDDQVLDDRARPRARARRARRRRGIPRRTDRRLARRPRARPDDPHRRPAERRGRPRARPRPRVRGLGVQPHGRGCGRPRDAREPRDRELRPARSVPRERPTPRHELRAALRADPRDRPRARCPAGRRGARRRAARTARGPRPGRARAERPVVLLGHPDALRRGGHGRAADDPRGRGPRERRRRRRRLVGLDLVGGDRRGRPRRHRARRLGLEQRREEDRRPARAPRDARARRGAREALPRRPLRRERGGGAQRRRGRVARRPARRDRGRPRVTVTAARVPLAGAVVGALVLLLASVVLATTLGPADVTAGEALASIAHHLGLGVDPPERLTDAIVWELRMPRTLTAAVVGAGLALAGAVMQSLTRNPLADPYLLGLSSGASLGAVAVLVLGLALALPVAAFAGALAALVLSLAIARAAGSLTPTRMVLAGLAVSQACAAATSVVIFWTAT